MIGSPAFLVGFIFGIVFIVIFYMIVKDNLMPIINPHNYGVFGSKEEFMGLVKVVKKLIDDDLITNELYKELVEKIFKDKNNAPNA